MTAYTIVNQTEAKRLLAAVSPANVLLLGPPGCGKTTLGRAYLSTHSLVLEVNGTQARDKLHDITWHKGGILIDEAHRIREPEALYPLLDTKLRTGFLVKKEVEQTFALTTTDEGLLPGPLLSRLVHVVLTPYTTQDLAAIGGLVAPKLPKPVLLEVAKLSWGSPRRVKLLTGLLDRVGGARHSGHVAAILSAMGYPFGLSYRQIALLDALALRPRSLSTLTGILGTGPQTIKMIEAELVQSGLVTISSRGRRLTGTGALVLEKVKEMKGVK